MYNQIFSEDFYPTPENVIFRMLGRIEVKGKTILEQAKLDFSNN